MKVWLVGEHNPVSPKPEHALYPSPPGCAGARLARALDLSPEEYLRRFERRNLMQDVEVVDRGTPRERLKWSAPRARARADAFLAEHPQGDALVLLGARVSAAFGVSFQENLWEPRFMQLGTGEVLRGRRTLVLPHPSGLSRAWNNKMAPLLARAGLERLVGT